MAVAVRVSALLHTLFPDFEPAPDRRAGWLADAQEVIIRNSRTVGRTDMKKFAEEG